MRTTNPMKEIKLAKSILNGSRNKPSSMLAIGIQLRLGGFFSSPDKIPGIIEAENMSVITPEKTTNESLALEPILATRGIRKLAIIGKIQTSQGA
jgi:hypothetical protein